MSSRIKQQRTSWSSKSSRHLGCSIYALLKWHHHRKISSVLVVTTVYTLDDYKCRIYEFLHDLSNTRGHFNTTPYPAPCHRVQFAHLIITWSNLVPSISSRVYSIPCSSHDPQKMQNLVLVFKVKPSRLIILIVAENRFSGPPADITIHKHRRSLHYNIICCWLNHWTVGTFPFHHYNPCFGGQVNQWVSNPEKFPWTAVDTES